MAGKARKGRLSPQTVETIYGLHPVREAIAAGRRTIYRVMVDRRTLSDRQAEVVRMAERRGIAWQVATPHQIRAEAGSPQHQGVAAAVSPLPVESLESVLDGAGRNGGACLLILLDGIVDPNNLGAIVRTAHCAGADALVIPKDRAVGATAAVSKVSAGALEHTRLCRVTNLAAAIRWLKKRGVWVAGLAMNADRSVFQAQLTGPLALVVGGEEQGLRPLIRQHCDYLISIPMRGRLDSLNASAAAAVVLYETFRQRQTPV